ncbi:hypothetical protein [Lutibacter sp.]
MKKITNPTLLFIIIIFLLSYSEWSYAHIKWFVEFDISDPPQSILSIVQKYYYIALLILSILGVIIASFIDSYWCKKAGTFTLISRQFLQYDDIALNIARIGTGIFFISIWLIGDVILTPELLSMDWYIPYIQLIIAVSLLFRQSLFIAGIGILLLYINGIYYYGLFHMVDYTLFIALAIFLILSSFKKVKFDNYRFPILYLGLIFSFLWSAIEKIAYPQWFYPFLEKYSFLTLGFNTDFFISSAAFIEFTLFFLLLITRNGVVLLAFIINLVVISGNIYFGKMDAIGHFPANFILLIMMIKGPLPIKSYFLNHSCKPYNNAYKNVKIYLMSLFLLCFFYYGLHYLLYISPQ